MPPDQLHRVELRSIRRQQHGVHAMAVAPKPSGHDRADMRFEPIPDHGDRGVHGPTHLAEEGENDHSIKVGIRQEAKIGSHPPASGRNHQGSNDTDFAPRPAALPQDGCAPPWGPGTAHHGGHQEGRFVDEDERRPPAGGVFFTRGHCWRTHRWMAASSRSRARRAGFWGLHPNPCSRRPTWST